MHGAMELDKARQKKKGIFKQGGQEGRPLYNNYL